MLPRDLQWPEDDPTSFPLLHPTGGLNTPVDPSLSPRRSQPEPLFTTDLDSDPIQYPYVYDVHVALLRTRYYYAKYMVYRPFVYKALHFPEQMTQDDAEGVAECLRVRKVPHKILDSRKLTTKTGMLEMATRTLSDFASQKTSTLSVLLVAELPLHPPHIPHDTAQCNATRHTSATLRSQIRSRG